MDSSNNNYIIGYTLEKSVLIINLIFIIFFILTQCVPVSRNRGKRRMIKYTVKN